MPLFFKRHGPAAMFGLCLALLTAACDSEAEADSYQGTWDPLFLTPQGEAFPLDNAGISFRDDEICFLRFDEQCFDAVYTQVGEVISVNIGGEPNSYLLHAPFDDYLVVQQAGDRPVFYIRRETD